MKKTIDRLLEPEKQPAPTVRPELKIRQYLDHDIYYYQARYFAVSKDQTDFDIERFRLQSTGKPLVGHTIKDLKEELERRAQQSGQQLSRVLLICHTPHVDLKAHLRNLQSQEVTVLTAAKCDLPAGPYAVLPYRDASGRESANIDIGNVSSELLQYLRNQKFDLVVIPYGVRKFWQGIQLEQFASALAPCLVNAFPGGESRMYRGEDVHRIQYNKAYLNSMFTHVPSIKGKNVLEVGCSDGLACDLLLCEEPRQIHGVDVMDSVGCAYSAPRIAYQRVSGSKLPFADNSFDLSYSIATMEHCFDPFKVMQEMKRVTAPGGYCYIQAGPLYFSPFGHHMFGYFDDDPWVHLRRSPAEMVERLRQHSLDTKIEGEFGNNAESYVHSMINIDHVNGRRLDEYGLEYFERSSDIDLIASTRSYEGENLLTDGISKELGHIPRKDLVAHGFELIFRKKR